MSKLKPIPASYLVASFYASAGQVTFYVDNRCREGVSRQMKPCDTEFGYTSEHYMGVRQGNVYCSNGEYYLHP